MAKGSSKKTADSTNLCTAWHNMHNTIVVNVFCSNFWKGGGMNLHPEVELQVQA